MQMSKIKFEDEMSRKLISFLVLFFIFCPEFILADQLKSELAKLSSRINDKIATTNSEFKFAIMNFKDIGSKTKEKKISKEVTGLLSHIINENKRFKILSKNDLYSAIREIKKSQSRPLKRNDLFAACRSIGAKGLIGGAVVDKGKNYQLIIRIIDVNSGGIIFSDKFNFEINSISSIGASTLSFFIPGLGQMYKKRKIRGWLFLATEVGLATTAALMYNKNDVAIQNMDNATSQEKIDEYYDESLLSHQIHNICIYTAAGLWFYNILDACFIGSSTNKKHSSNINSNKFKFIIDNSNNQFAVKLQYRLNF